MIDILFQWITTNKMIIWLLVALFCLFFEMGSPGLFFFLSFFFGAIIAAVSTVLFKTWLLQSTVFVIGTCFSFIMLRQWVKRGSKTVDTHAQTNMYAMRSKRGMVLKKITAEKMGKVKVEGEIWSARSLKGETIEQGVMVVVVRIKGAHVIVEETK